MGYYNSKHRVLLILTLAIAFTMVIYYMFIYLLEQPKLSSLELSSIDAYFIILSNFHNFSEPEITKLMENKDLETNYISNYVVVKGNGNVYEVNRENKDTLKKISETEIPISGGTHYSWQIDINGTKYYVDSTSGQIISVNQS